MLYKLHQEYYLTEAKLKRGLIKLLEKSKIKNLQLIC